MRDRRGGTEHLRRLFGISQALAERIAELLDAGVVVAEDVLRAASPGSPVERSLLDGGLLKAGRFHGEALDASVSGLRAVKVPSGWRIERVAGAVDRCEPGRIARREALLREEEVRKLFSEEEIAALKVELLTATDAHRRVEALRKLALSPLPAHRKGALFLHSLADEDAVVKREALACLESLGMGHEVVSLLQRLFEADDAVRETALRRLSGSLERLSEGERGVVLLVLVEYVKLEDEGRREVVALIRQLASLLGRETSLAVGLVERMCDVPSWCRWLPSLCGALAGTPAAAEVRGVLLERMAACSEVEQRLSIVAALWGLGCSGGDLEVLVGATVDVLKSYGYVDERSWDLVVAVESAPDDVVLEVVKAFENADDTARIVLGVALDRAYVRPERSSRLRRRVEKALMGALGVGNRVLRNRLLELALWRHRFLSTSARAAFVREVVRCLEGAGEYQRSLIYSNVTAMGEAAIEPLKEIVVAALSEEEKSAALELMGKVASSFGRPAQKNVLGDVLKVARDVLKFASGRTAAAAALCIGRSCTAAVIDAEEVGECIELLVDSLHRGGLVAAVLQALSLVCGSEALQLPHMVRLVEILSEVLVSVERLPSATAGSSLVERMEIGPDAVIQSDLIPPVIDGLLAIYLHPAASVGMRRRIFTLLLEKWHKVMCWEEVWGPASVMKLTAALERMGMDERTAHHEKMALLREFSGKVDTPRILLACARVLSTMGGSPAETEVCGRIFERLRETTDEFRSLSGEERAVVLEAVGLLAACVRVAEDADSDLLMRKQMIEVLFDGVRDNVEGAVDSLRRLASSGNVPRPLRTDIRRRLKYLGTRDG